MRRDFDDIKDRDLGKKAIVCGLGPSLSTSLSDLLWINRNARHKASFYSCNLFDLMTDLTTDYWVVANSQDLMKIKNAHHRYNKQKGSTLIFASRITGFETDLAEDLLEIDYIPMGDHGGIVNSLPDYFKNYCSANLSYGAVNSVAIHMIAIAIITGCKEIYISGVDLDYSRGYVKNGVHDEGVSLGKSLMKEKQAFETIDQIKFLQACAVEVGVKMYSLTPNTYISKILEYKNPADLRNEIETCS